MGKEIIVNCSTGEVQEREIEKGPRLPSVPGLMKRMKDALNSLLPPEKQV